MAFGPGLLTIITDEPEIKIRGIGQNG